MLCWSRSIQTRACLTAVLLAISLCEGQVYGASREQIIPILGVTTGQNQVGTVSYVRVSFDERQDQAGLMCSSTRHPEDSRAWPSLIEQRSDGASDLWAFLPTLGRSHSPSPMQA